MIKTLLLALVLVAAPLLAQQAPTTDLRPLFGSMTFAAPHVAFVRAHVAFVRPHVAFVGARVAFALPTV